MVLLLILGTLAVLVAIPVTYAIANPIVNVVDDLTTTSSYAAVDSELASLLGRARGYSVQIMAPGTYTLSYRQAPAWALILGLITFPVGIIIVLLARETLTLNFSATATESGTRILVLGRVHTKLARGIGDALQRRLKRLGDVRVTGP